MHLSMRAPSDSSEETNVELLSSPFSLRPPCSFSLSGYRSQKMSSERDGWQETLCLVTSLVTDTALTSVTLGSELPALFFSFNTGLGREACELVGIEGVSLDSLLLWLF